MASVNLPTNHDKQVESNEWLLLKIFMLVPRNPITIFIEYSDMLHWNLKYLIYYLKWDNFDYNGLK